MVNQSFRGRKYTSSKITVKGRQIKNWQKSKKKKSSQIRRNVNIGAGFPMMIKTKLHYVDSNLSSTVGAGTISQWKYIMNGLYDFDFTGTGHQPFYFDQYMALYDHYTVLGCKVTIAFTNTSTVPMIVGAFINDDTTTTPTALNDLMEQPTARWRLIPTGNVRPIYLTYKWSAKKFFAGKGDPVNNPSLFGTASANPTEQSVLNLFMRAVDGQSSYNYTYSLRAEFFVKFSELKDISGS